MKGLIRILGIAALGASVMLGGCVMIESSSIGPRTATGQPISAQADGWGFLRLYTPPGLTTAANSKLAASCTSGKFTNPQTELSMRDWLIIAQDYTVTADAVCE